jgi:hypothetical protein
MKKRALVSSVTIAILGATLSVGMAAGQEAMAPHPAHVHVGSCPAPADVVGPLSDVSGQFLMDGEAMMTPAMGQATAIPVEASFTSAVPLAYADLFASPHSIVVHQSAEDIGTYILCGDIGGPEIGTTDIAVGLGPLNDSGYTGIATIHDNGDTTVKVSLYITLGHAMMAEPMASPAA